MMKQPSCMLLQPPLKRVRQEQTGVGWLNAILRRITSSLRRDSHPQAPIHKLFDVRRCPLCPLNDVNPDRTRVMSRGGGQLNSRGFGDELSPSKGCAAHKYTARSPSSKRGILAAPVDDILKNLRWHPIVVSSACQVVSHSVRLCLDLRHLVEVVTCPKARHLDPLTRFSAYA